MKTIITILLISISIFIASCVANKPTTTEIVMFTDLTGVHLAEPDAKELIRLYDFEDNKWSGGIFRSSVITNVSFNQADQISIEPGNEWSSSFPLKRSENINQFQKSIEDIITKNRQSLIGKNNSSIYFPIVKELNRLSQSQSNRKYLLIFSDLMENDPKFSFYKPNKLKELRENPDSIKNALENEISLESLSGITIYLIYQPTDTAKDEQYKIVSKFFQQLFEGKGARVIITPNITI